MSIAEQLLEVRTLQDQLLGKRLRYFGNTVNCYFCGSPLVACAIVLKNSINEPDEFRACVEARCPNHPNTPVVVTNAKGCQPLEAEPDELAKLADYIVRKEITDSQIREAHTKEWTSLSPYERMRRGMKPLTIKAVQSKILT